MAKILKKLTIRDAIGGKAAILEAAQSGRVKGKDEAGKEIFLPEGKPVPLLTVIGQVHGVKAGEGDNGSFVKLFGIFEATNLITGEVLSDVGIAILPNFVSSGIAGAINAGAQSVDFAVTIQTRYVESAATMYVFEADSLMKPVESPALAGLKASLAAQGIMLPAPKVQAIGNAASAAQESAKAAPAPAPAVADKKASGKR